jgi:hypothetical protein
LPAAWRISIIAEATESIALLFVGADGAGLAGFPCRFQGLQPTQRDKKMKQFSKLTAAPAAALFALAFVAIATPASAGEYCRQDITSGMRSCSFETLAQCQAMSSGRGGDCYRDPFLPAASSAFAYLPKHSHSRKPAAN